MYVDTQPTKRASLIIRIVPGLSLPRNQARLLHWAATHSTWDQPGGVSIQRARDFKFLKSWRLSGTIGHHW